MKQLYKFLISAIILLGCIAVVDCIGGLALDRMLDNVPNDGNETGETHFAINKVTDPILIIGSSRAKYHYRPNIISDSLAMDTYNLGRRGYYLTYQCCLINMILDRYTPNILIWDFSMDSLFSNGNDNIDKLRPYYWKYYSVREAFNEKEGKIRSIKNLSKIYRYNSLALSIIYRYLHGGADTDPLKGMGKLINTGISVDPALSIYDGLTGPIDQARVKRLHTTLQRLIDSGVTVFVFDSPHYSLLNPNRDRSSESIIYEECQKLSIPIFDNRNYDYFLHHPELFYDEGHLFDDGSEIYTKIVASQICQELSINKLVNNDS